MITSVDSLVGTNGVETTADTSVLFVVGEGDAVIVGLGDEVAVGGI